MTKLSSIAELYGCKGRWDYSTPAPLISLPSRLKLFLARSRIGFYRFWSHLMQSALDLVTWLEEEDEDGDSSDSSESSTRRRALDECDDHVLATIDAINFNDLTPLATCVAEATDAVPPARIAVKAAAAAIEDADAYAAKTAKHYKAEEACIRQ